MSSDLPDDDDPDGHADRRDDHDGEGGQAAGAGGSQAETRSRSEYYVDLRAEVAAEETAAAQRTSAREQAAAGRWQEKSAESRSIWEEYQRKWPPDERAPTDRSGDRGTSRDDRGLSLDNAVNDRVELECDRIAARERDKISPALRAIESQDPDRHLIGFEHRLKGRDRIAEKVHEKMKEFELLSRGCCFDCIRYDPLHLSVPRRSLYSRRLGGYRTAEGTRLRAAQTQESPGLMTSTKASTASGSSRIPASGSKCSFTPSISFEAKQLTHDAYERLRTGQADKLEQLVLEAFQRKVTA